MQHSIDEYLDLVDEQDNVIGRKKRSEIYAEDLSNFRVVNVFIVNLKDDLPKLIKIFFNYAGK